ncbi:MAG: hypothetical protein JRD93_12600 [Deltaproteobacteria bacterium]|nr:hypothetical protein [Deltaproteobacteria bacterium]
MSDILIKAEGVSKKFCKSLKRLMFYGVQDIARSMDGMSEKTGKLKSREFWANNDISFELKRGECLGLIGPNGSGMQVRLGFGVAAQTEPVLSRRVWARVFLTHSPKMG